MRSDDLATLFTSLPGLGAKWFSGTVVSWDDLTGSNVVNVEDAYLEDLSILSTWAIQPMQPGDTVCGFRVGSRYFILGKVGAPGSGAANQIQSQMITDSIATSSTTFDDLPGSYGPEVVSYIGSSRRVLLTLSVGIKVAGTVSGGGYIGGQASIQVTGASTIDVTTLPQASAEIWATASPISGLGLSVTRQILLTADDGINTGLTTFTVKYKSDTASPTAGFGNRVLTVFPI